MYKYIVVVLVAVVTVPVFAQTNAPGSFREFNRPDQQQTTPEPVVEEDVVEEKPEIELEPVLLINIESPEEGVVFVGDETEEEQIEIRRQRESMKQRDRISPSELQDSDGDGLVDYDELTIYGTSPNNPNTGGGPYNDGEDIRRGLDPLSSTEDIVLYDDPRPDTVGEVAAGYQVERVTREQDEIVRIEGRAQPRAFVAVYVFSRPIVVTVQANGQGRWSYRLEKQLDDGTHEIYVASVNNRGKILLKSPPFAFAQEAEAQGTTTTDQVGGTTSWWSFLYNDMYWLGALVIVIALLIAVVLAGIPRRQFGRRDEEAVTPSEDTTPPNNVPQM